MTVVVIAKEPVPGRVKTRLCPPLSAGQAARLAEAALLDTLDVARASDARTLLALDGTADGWLPGGVDVIPQRAGGLGDRLSGVFDDVGGPALVIGMDTPQVSPEDLNDGIRLLRGGSCDAVLGPASDGGYWAIGLRRPAPRVFAGVPMSTDGTRQRQLANLDRLGLRVASLRMLRDVDRYEDAVVVGDEVPGTRFASVLASVTTTEAPAPRPGTRFAVRRCRQ